MESHQDRGRDGGRARGPAPTCLLRFGHLLARRTTERSEESRPHRFCLALSQIPRGRLKDEILRFAQNDKGERALLALTLTQPYGRKCSELGWRKSCRGTAMPCPAGQETLQTQQGTASPCPYNPYLNFYPQAALRYVLRTLVYPFLVKSLYLIIIECV